MKIGKVFFEIIFFLQIWKSEAASTYNSRQANRKQKKLIEGSMDLRANPCEDFYQFACGNWNQLHLEAGLAYFEPITLLDYNVNREMSRVLDRLHLRNKPKFVHEVYKYYKSCVNLSKYEAKQYLIWLRDNEQLQWPSAASESNTQVGWPIMLAKMRTYGFNDVFVQEIVLPRKDDRKKFIIDLDKPTIDGGFKTMTYLNFQVLMASLPASMPARELEKLWKEIKQFEQELQQLDEIEDIEIETINDFEKEHFVLAKDLSLHWLKDYLKVIMNQTEISPHMKLYIQNMPYMKALDDLIQKQNQRFPSKYLIIRFLWFLHQQGPSNFVEEDCLSSTRGLFPIAMHWLYEQQHPELMREYSTIYEIFDNVRKHFNNTVLKNNYGFNATVIRFLQDKINNMKLKLNNVPRTETMATLTQFYKDLDLHANKFYENHLKLLRFNFKAYHDLLDSKQPSLDITYLENAETGASSSPFFMQSANTVFIPLTLLQYPIYHPDLDDIYKYSSLGFLLAHEMFHGFDDSGLLVDSNGNVVSLEFEENPLFNASFSCLTELNPLVISEKIADISGLRYSYQAYFDSNLDASTKTRRIYGNELPLSQIFFLNFAQFFCGNVTPEDFETMSDHGLDSERVADAVAHFPEFSKAFKCTRANRMYPHETCHLWRR